MSDLLVKVRSRAFGVGLRDGFAAPANLFMHHARSCDFDTARNIEDAWKDVGGALKSAETVERGHIGKNTGKTSKQSRAA